MSGEETRARFLSAIAAQLPVDRVQEVHLFAPIRQGGMESGVAVIAVDFAPAPGDADSGVAANAGAETNADVDANVGVDANADVDANVGVDANADVDASAQADTPTEPAAATSETLQELLDEVPVEPDTTDASAPPARATRYTVYSARYRHTLKGPDRGKWEISVTDEADAPLLTVDAVVRGVSRRSGEADETVRLSGDEFRAAVASPARA